MLYTQLPHPNSRVDRVQMFSALLLRVRVVSLIHLQRPFYALHKAKENGQRYRNPESIPLNPITPVIPPLRQC